MNPAETCLTPPPEAATSHSECEDANSSSTTSAVCATLDQGIAQLPAPITVQDASNQTDTPPVSEDENCSDSGPIQEKLHVRDLQVSTTRQNLVVLNVCVLRRGSTSPRHCHDGSLWRWYFLL